MMAIDVEHFRLYNQLHGMEEGDNLLRFIADMLRTYQEAQGGVSGYLGGDNFALVTEYNKETLDQLRLGIREEIRRKNNTTGYPPAYGIYIIEDRSESATVMYHRATLALSYVIGNYTSRVKEYYPDIPDRHLLSLPGWCFPASRCPERPESYRRPYRLRSLHNHHQQ